MAIITMTVDGRSATVDVDPNTAGNQSTINFKMAPLHDGLEGSKYFVVTLALALSFGSGGPASVSGIVTQPDRIESSTNLGGQGFLGFPESIRYCYTLTPG